MTLSVSYLFRSLGSVVAVAAGSSLVQNSLRSSLREKLNGADADEVFLDSFDFDEIFGLINPPDCSEGSPVTGLPR